MKKLLMLIVSALLVFGMTACSGSGTDVASDTDDSTEETAAEQINETESNDVNSGAETLEGQAGNGKWLSGERFGADVSDDELKAWIDEVGAE